MMPKRFILTIIALLLIGAAAAACGGKNGVVEEYETGRTVTGDSARTLKIFNFKVEMAEQLSALTRRYQEETGVRIELDTCGGGCDYSAELKTRFNSGDKPDLFFVAGYTDLDLWQEYLEDLTGEPWADDMQELAKPAITKDGRVYGMPLAMEGWGFIYNKELFRKAGIESKPVTLSGLRAAAQRLEAAGIRPFENGYAEWWVLGNHLLNTAFALQPAPADYIERFSSGSAKFTGNTAFEAWLDLIDLTLEYGQETPLQTDYYTQIAHFADGQAAMMQQGSWTQLQLDKLAPDLDIGFLPMPVNDNAEEMDNLQIGVANYWVVLKNSRMKEEAKAFLRWLASSDAGRTFIVDEARLIPALKSIPAADGRLGPLAEDIIAYMDAGRTLPWLWQRYPGYEATTSQMSVQMQAYIGEQIGRERLLEEFQRIWDTAGSNK
ncbi:extracellular solute-binding protein [Paenibacillus typhae]|uniref:Carbohydrate ABC transporter substrate-binding protein, CUT1 family n=1 Tax=Paenibacillus typhae TaxID=1174501 RepID=A0A1G8J601_9BACL|nr:ABC transporter substrate-binding protein [Paenibacillus typhae]SDI26616.1 carbohydrate ABC transporter substrate-binding protein, CUT1 family [Paenibacillus typhae]